MVGLYGGQSFNAGSGSEHVGHILPGILGETAFWAGVWAIVFGLFAVYGIKAMAWMGRFAVVSVTILAREVGLIVAGVGVSSGALSADIYTTVIIMVALTTIITPVWLKIAYGKDGNGTSERQKPTIA